MLAKLLKYEFKATARYFLPLYLAMLVVAVICRVLYSFDVALDYLPTLISTLVLFAIIVATFVLSFILTINRFHKSLLTDEGYLMMTLPVSVHQHIWSKAIVAAVWITGSFVATGLAMLMMFATADAWTQFMSVVEEIKVMASSEYGFHAIIWVLMVLVLLTIDIFQKLNSVYMCIAVGSQSAKHKLLLGIGAFVVYMIVIEIIGTIFGHIFSAIGLFDWYSALAVNAQIYLGIIVLLVVDTAMFVLVYFVTTYILKNRLNLE